MARKFGYFLIVVLFIGLIFSSTDPAFAILSTGSYGSGSYGSCGYGSACSISISSSGSMAVNVTPSPSGTCSTNYDSVSVLTDDANGYALTISNSSATNDSLVSGANTISSTTATDSSPATLSVNQWGYRVDALSSGNYATYGSFGSGPTTVVTNTAFPITQTFALTPLNGSNYTLATDSGAADPADNTTVWFGVCANSTVISGTYSTTVVYSAVAN